MVEMSKSEKAWRARVQRALDACPTNRFGFYTIGDSEVGIYDKATMTEQGLGDNDTDLVSTISHHDLHLGSLAFPDHVDGVCG